MRLLADGSRARYIRLAHKYREPKTGKPRDKILHRFGRAEDLDRDQIRRFIKSLARFLEPHEQARVQAQLDGLGADLSVERSLSYGGSYVLDRLWRRIGIDEALRRLLRDRSFKIDVDE